MTMQPLDRAPGRWSRQSYEIISETFCSSINQTDSRDHPGQGQFLSGSATTLFRFFRFGLALLDFAVFAVLTARGFNPACAASHAPAIAEASFLPSYVRLASVRSFRVDANLTVRLALRFQKGLH